MLPNSNYVFYNKMQICREKQLFSIYKIATKLA